MHLYSCICIAGKNSGLKIRRLPEKGRAGSSPASAPKIFSIISDYRLHNHFPNLFPVLLAFPAHQYVDKRCANKNGSFIVLNTRVVFM
jgi:hypothetical protein